MRRRADEPSNLRASNDWSPTQLRRGPGLFGKGAFGLAAGFDTTAHQQPADYWLQKVLAVSSANAGMQNYVSIREHQTRSIQRLLQFSARRRSSCARICRAIRFQALRKMGCALTPLKRTPWLGW